jgi:hypothetical protein
MRWEWRRTTDEKTWTAMMVIQYRRKEVSGVVTSCADARSCLR